VHARRVWPPVGLVRFGGLRRLTPISRSFGADRGVPIDRYYIEDFLRRHAGQDDYVLGDIRGRVLEVGDNYYARRFGAGSSEGPSRIEKVDVLHVDEANPQATIIDDLTSGEHIPSDTFDCVICTQTLLLIYDLHGAVKTLHRILKPGGVLLATVPGVSKICRPDADLWGDYWRFTSSSARLLFQEAFRPEDITVEAYGNVLASIAFLHGLAADELRGPELDLRDPDYEVLIAVRAVKARGG
jgi:SAM-dependent methyltransferase